MHVQYCDALLHACALESYTLYNTGSGAGPGIFRRGVAQEGGGVREGDVREARKL